jgi:hypothetical protein
MASAPGEDSLVLNLVIEDTEVITELRRRAEGHARNTFASSALRIGILALRQAQGNVDADILRNEGQRLIADLNREMALGVQQIDSKIAGSLKLYFDPQSDHFNERIGRLVRKDGDLETVLRLQIGDGESSELARTLARRIGESSPLMRRLDPLRLRHASCPSHRRNIVLWLANTFQIKIEPIHNILQPLHPMPRLARPRKLMALPRKAHHYRWNFFVFQSLEELLPTSRRRRPIVRFPQDEHHWCLDVVHVGDRRVRTI